MALPDFEKGKAFAEKGFLMQAEGTKLPAQKKISFEPSFFGGAPKVKLLEEGEEPSLLADFTSSAIKGQIQGKVANILSAGKKPTPEELGEIAQLQSDLQLLPQSKSEKAYQEKGLKGLFTDSPALGVQFVAETMASSLSSLFEASKRTVPSAVAMGAVAGAPFAGIGALAGAATGLVAGQSAAGYNLSTSQDILSSLSENGVDVSNKESLINAFSDETKMAKIRNTAAKYGVPILVFDAVTAGLAGKLAAGAIGKGLSKKLLAGVGETGLQITGGSGGELAAQLASGKNVNWDDIIIEGLAEVPGGATEVASGVIIERSKSSSNNKTLATQIATQGVENGLQDSYVNLNRDLANNVITPEQHQEGINFVEKAAQVAEKIPETVQGESRVKSIELLVERNNIKDANQNLLQQKQTTDEAYHAGIDQEIKANEENIKKIDSEVYDISKKPSKEFGGKKYIKSEFEELKPIKAKSTEKTIPVIDERGEVEFAYNVPVSDERTFITRKDYEAEVNEKVGWKSLEKQPVEAEVKPTEVDLTTAKKMNASQNRYGIIKDGAEAGFIVATNPENNVVKIKGVTVNEELRGKNIAGDAYVKLGESLAKEGISLESDSFDKMEPSATRVWEKLSDKGLAVKGENSYQFKPTEVKETIKTTENAIQEPSPEGVLQPEQERVRETGGERKRVEPSVKGKEIAKEGKQVEGDEKVVAKKTYQEALKEKQEAEKKQTRQVAGEKSAVTKEIYRKVNETLRPLASGKEGAQEIALRYLADGGKVSKAAVDEAYGSTKRAELNVRRRELLSEEVKSKDFVQGNEKLDDLAHRLWQDNKQKVSERDIKDKLMAEIGNNNTRLEAAEAYLDQYNAEYKLEKQEMRLAEQYKEEYLEEQAKLEEELRKPLDEQIEGEASEEHINNLIKQYEAEIKGEDQQIRPESEGEVSSETGKGEAVKEASKAEERLAQEYKEVVKKASKKAKENAKKDFVDRNFDSIVAKLKIQIKCPT